MPAPAVLAQRLAREFRQPRVNPEWLDACYAWITTELGVNAANNEEIYAHVRQQLLQSDLCDSMLHNTGFPAPQAAGASQIAGPVLCQIVALTEIAHSAFSLKATRQNIVDRDDLAGLYVGDEEALEEEAGRVPTYPRGMLRFQLSDGSVVYNAIEYRKITQLQLGKTLLGYKLQLRDVPTRGGYLLLEPDNVVLLGGAVDELDEHRDRDFVRGLNMRLGQPDAGDEEPPRPASPQVRVPNVPRGASPAPAQQNRVVVEDDDFFDFDEEALRQLDAIDEAHAASVQSPSIPPPQTADEDDELDIEMLDAAERQYAADTARDTAADGFSDFDFDLDDEMIASLDALEENARSATVTVHKKVKQEEIIYHIDSDEEPLPPPRASQRGSQRQFEEEVIEISD